MNWLNTPHKILAAASLTLCIAGILQGPAFAQTLETHPVFDVGDKWTYSFQNRGERKEPYTYTHQVYKLDSESGWLYGETKEPNTTRPQSIWRYDFKRADNKEGFNFNPTTPTKPGERYSNRQANDDWVQLPLFVGKKYKVKEFRSNGELFVEYDAEVSAFEKVKMPAGEFDAFRISGVGWFRNQFGNHRVSQRHFYAPTVKRLVKGEYIERDHSVENVWELIKWEPKAELMSALVAPAPAATASAPAPAAAPSQ